MLVWRLLVLTLLLISQSVLAERIALVSPPAQGPYASVFQQIDSGFKQVAKDYLSIEVDRYTTASQLANKLRAANVNTVVLLGKSGYRLARQISDEFKVLVGAYPLIPKNLAGISMVNDPDSVFIQLRKVAPDVRRVFLVYSEKQAWLERLAQQRASEYGIELVSKKVASLSDAALTYQELVENVEPTSDAFWVTLDPISGRDRVVLPTVLEASWEKRFVVFSSKPSHAKRGVLFALYPDNKKMGSRLAQMAVALKNNQTVELEAVRDTKLAVNLRVAAHLGLNYDKALRSEFAVVFPEG